jgi:hypothetical protein
VNKLVSLTNLCSIHRPAFETMHGKQVVKVNTGADSYLQEAFTDKHTQVEDWLVAMATQHLKRSCVLQK